LAIALLNSVNLFPKGHLTRVICCFPIIDF